MTSREYQTLTNDLAKGRRVITLREMRTHYFIVPAYSQATITRKFNGFDLEFDHCASCGVRVRMCRVPRQDVELLKHPGTSS